MAACKLASQGKTMADSTYDMEVQTLRTLLSRQTPGDAPVTPIQVDIKNPEDYVAPRFYKKLKGKQVNTLFIIWKMNVRFKYHSIYSVY